MIFKYQLLRQLRESHGVTLNAMSRLSGIPLSNLTRWELGQRHPGAKNLARLAKIFDVKMEIFFEEGKPMKWKKYATLGEDYTVWTYDDGTGPTYQIIRNEDTGPTGTGGYNNLEAAIAQKGYAVQRMTLTILKDEPE